MALPNPNIRCKEALPRIASLAKNQCNKEAGCREATATATATTGTSKWHGLSMHHQCSSLFICFPYFPYWTWHNLIHFGGIPVSIGIHRYPGIFRHDQPPEFRLSMRPWARWCHLSWSYCSHLWPCCLLANWITTAAFCLWNPISVFGCFWRFPGNVGRQSNISHQVSPERFMGTPAPYPNDPKITEEGKAMSSKLGSAGGTAHCDG